MKWFVRILAVLLVLIAALVFIANFYMGAIVVKAVNTAGPAAVGVPVKLQDANFRLLRGHLTLRGFLLGNPEGFKTDKAITVDEVTIDLDPKSLFSETIVIKRIYIKAPDVTYELGLGKSNIGRILELAGGSTNEAAAREQEKKPAAEEEGGKKVVIEDLLIENGHAKTAKAFILYREKRSGARNMNALIGATIDMFSAYLGDKDWRIKENANTQKSINGLNNYVREFFTKNYWLHEVYPAEVREAHESGDAHIHDLGFLGPYCAGWDLKQLLMYGFGGVPGKVESSPAKHLRSFLGQIVNSTFTTQGESAGAQAWSSFDTYCAPFIRYDRLSYAQVKQSLQEFIFNINVPTRVGFQCPFSNLTFDLTVPKILKDQAVIRGGKAMEEKYGDFQEEMDIFNQAFCEVMMTGDAKGRVFTFPIPTINVTRDFDCERVSQYYLQIWHTVLCKLHQFGALAGRRGIHVLPFAARHEGIAFARRRPVWQQPVDGVHWRIHDQFAAYRLFVTQRAGIQGAFVAHGADRAHLAGNQAQGDRKPDGARVVSLQRALSARRKGAHGRVLA